jgi:hypothetical protein
MVCFLDNYACLVHWGLLRQSGVADILSPPGPGQSHLHSIESFAYCCVGILVHRYLLSFAMGVGDAPYLYDPPSRRQIAYPYSDFDPKAVTRASWISATESTVSKPKKEGPLIDFNRHPDSYMVQFGFRLVQLLGAVGCLLCVIFVRNTEKAQGWIMRIPVSKAGSLRDGPDTDMYTASMGHVHHCLRRLSSSLSGKATHASLKC